MASACDKKINSKTKYQCIDEEFDGESAKQLTLYKGLQPYVLKQLKIVLFLTIGNLIVGYTFSWLTPIGPKLKDPQQTPLPYLLWDENISWIASSLIIGAIIGSNISGYIANKIGRKSCLLVISCFNLIGNTITANASNMAALLTGRIITGAAAGSINVLNVVYIGEIASPKIRGALTALSVILHMVGSLLVYSIGPYVSFPVVSYVCVGISCIHTLALCYIPESPVYYVLGGKINDAELVLHDLGRTDDIKEEIRLFSENVNETLPLQTKGNQGRHLQKWWRTLIFEKRNRKALLITTVLLCLQTSGGVVAVILFATTIFKNAHSSVNPNVGTIILGLTELCGGILTPLLIERSGRKILLLMSLGCSSVCMVILGTYFYFEVNHYMMIKSIRWLPLVLLMISLFTYNIGISVVPNTLTGEMYSPHLRSIGSSISMTIAWSLALATGSSYTYIVSALRNHGVFWLYSAINALGFIFTIFVVPETKGRNLMEVGCLLERED